MKATVSNIRKALSGKQSIRIKMSFEPAVSITGARKNFGFTQVRDTRGNWSFIIDPVTTEILPE